MCCRCKFGFSQSRFATKKWICNKNKTKSKKKVHLQQKQSSKFSAKWKFNARTSMKMALTFYDQMSSQFFRLRCKFIISDWFKETLFKLHWLREKCTKSEWKIWSSFPKLDGFGKYTSPQPVAVREGISRDICEYSSDFWNILTMDLLSLSLDICAWLSRMHICRLWLFLLNMNEIQNIFEGGWNNEQVNKPIFHPPTWPWPPSNIFGLDRPTIKPHCCKVKMKLGGGGSGLVKIGWLWTQFLAHSSYLTFRDKKYRILPFCNKKYRSLTFRDKK